MAATKAPAKKSSAKKSSSSSSSRSSSSKFKATGDPVDQVGPDNVNQASKVEEVPKDQKAGPRSVQSQEIRPDERDLAPGSSAFQEPAPA